MPSKQEMMKSPIVEGIGVSIDYGSLKNPRK